MRPIDADALNVAIENAKKAMEDCGNTIDAKIAKIMIEVVTSEICAPTLDYAPVRHGEWRQYKLYVPKGRGQTYSVYGCSLCHKHERKRADYCPNCGAKMDGGWKHDET